MAFIMQYDDPTMHADSLFYPMGARASLHNQPGAEAVDCVMISMLVDHDAARLVMHGPDQSTATTHVRLNRALVARLAAEMGLITDDPIHEWEPEPDPTTSWPNTYDKLISDTRAACACG